MKRNHFLFSLIVVLSLTACISINDEVETKAVPIFDIDLPLDNDEQPNNLEQYQIGTIEPIFRQGQEYIPYLSLEQYASLYDHRLIDGAKSVITNNGSVATWQIFKDDTLYFYSAISYWDKMVIKAGDISNVFKNNDDPTPRKALNYALSTTANYEKIGEDDYETYSFGDISLTRLFFDSSYYYPLGFLDLTYSETSTIYHFYNYYGIFETRDVENFSEKEFLFENNLETVDTLMQANTHHNKIPVYLINYNANMFFYTMDNFYGLRKEKGITSFKQFLKSKNVYNDLFSTNDFLRGCAYYTALSLMDDGHTAVISINDTWGEADSGPMYVGQKTSNRGAEYRAIRDVRANQNQYPNFIVEDGVRYSDSGKTAIIIFDGFSFGKDDEVFNPDGTIKEDAYLYDTYLRVARSLETIRNKGTVENVVLDISLNGGGTLAIMMKLLAIISKDNVSNTHFFDDAAKYVYLYKGAVDTNLDNEYDASDAYGNDFNFFVATSAMSYSAANAYAYYAKKDDIATIIGRKTGGGECAVSIHYLPNSQYVYHSSNLHIGFYNESEGKFYGNEAGVEPDIYFDDYGIYGNPNAIEDLIS